MPWLWLVVGVVLAVAEAFSATFVLIMFAAGALAAAGSAALGADLWLQILVFAGVSAAALGVARPALRQRFHLGAEAHPMGIESIEGAEGLVLKTIDRDSGSIKIDGEIWNARAYDVTQTIEVGARVRVIEIKGATALVWRD